MNEVIRCNGDARARLIAAELARRSEIELRMRDSEFFLPIWNNVKIV